MMSYAEYRSNEIELITKGSEKRFKMIRELGIPLEPFQVMTSVVIKDLYSKEFLIYFMAHQDELVKKQKEQMEKLK